MPLITSIFLFLAAMMWGRAESKRRDAENRMTMTEVAHDLMHDSIAQSEALSDNINWLLGECETFLLSRSPMGAHLHIAYKNDDDSTTSKIFHAEHAQSVHSLVKQGVEFVAEANRKADEENTSTSTWTGVASTSCESCDERGASECTCPKHKEPEQQEKMF